MDYADSATMARINADDNAGTTPGPGRLQRALPPASYRVRLRPQGHGAGAAFISVFPIASACSVDCETIDTLEQALSALLSVLRLRMAATPAFLRRSSRGRRRPGRGRSSASDNPRARGFMAWASRS